MGICLHTLHSYIGLFVLSYLLWCRQTNTKPEHPCGKAFAFVTSVTERGIKGPRGHGGIAYPPVKSREQHRSLHLMRLDASSHAYLREELPDIVHLIAVLLGRI